MRAAPLRHGRGRGRRAADPRAAAADARPLPRRHGRRRLGAVHHPVLHALRRRRLSPVASRHAKPEELLALSKAVAEHEGTQLEAIVAGCLDQFSDDEIDLFVDMSAAAGRPLNWNVLTIDAAVPERVPRQLIPSERARKAGGRIVALTMPILTPMNMSLGTFCALNLIPGWGDVLGLPGARAHRQAPRPGRPGRDAASAPTARRRASSGGSRNFDRYVIGDTYTKENEGLTGRVVDDIAAERGQEAFQCLVEICANDELRTVLWPMPTDNDPASWALRQQSWQHEDVMLGGSDAGAHLDRMCGAPYTTRFIGDCLRGRKLVGLEQAVKMLTDDPAQLFGLRRPGPHRGGLPRRPGPLRPGAHRRGQGDPGARPAG